MFTIHTCATGVLSVSDTYNAPAVFQKAAACAQQLNPSTVVSDFESSLKCCCRQLPKRPTQRLSLFLLPGMGILENSS